MIRMNGEVGVIVMSFGRCRQVLLVQLWCVSAAEIARGL